MASKFFEDSVVEDSHESVTESGFFIEIWETNYHFHKRFPVLGDLSVGQLVFKIVQEIGKKVFPFFSKINLCDFAVFLERWEATNPEL